MSSVGLHRRTSRETESRGERSRRPRARAQAPSRPSWASIWICARGVFSFINNFTSEPRDVALLYEHPLRHAPVALRRPCRRYTRAEVAKHATPESNWIIIDDKVYDVTKFARFHPGGKAFIDKVAGSDATKHFTRSTVRTCSAP